MGRDITHYYTVVMNVDASEAYALGLLTVHYTAANQQSLRLSHFASQTSDTIIDFLSWFSKGL